MTTNYISALASVLYPYHYGAVLEHRAICCSSEDMQPSITALKTLGYELVHETPEGSCFFNNPRNPNDRIELLAHNGIPHEAWAVRTRKEFLALRSTLSCHNSFTAIGTPIEEAGLWANMFLHDGSGHVVQIIRRATPIYEGIFDNVDEDELAWQ